MSPESQIFWLVLGITLGSIPQIKLGRIMVAWLSKRLGVKPKDIENYQEATDEENQS